MMISTNGFSTEDRAAVLQLVGDYGYFHDERDFENLATLFAEDASYLMTIAGGETIGPRLGRGAIVNQIADFKSRQSDTRRHMITNVAVRPVDGDTAEVRSYLTLLSTSPDRSSTRVITAGIYRDRVERRAGVWVFAAKHLVLDRVF